MFHLWRGKIRIALICALLAAGVIFIVIAQKQFPIFAYTIGNVRSYKKISSTEGNFTGALDDGDQFGVSVDEIGDLNNDGIIDLIAGAWKDDDGGTDYGAAYILFMRRNGTVLSSQKISATSGGFTGTFDPAGFGSGADDFGQTVSGIGDLDGDGVEDVVIGERANDDGGNDRGAFYVVFLNADGTVKAEQKVSDTAGGFTGTLDNFDTFGGCAEAIDDVNGDTVPDLAICAASDDDGGADRGAVWVLYMNTDGTVNGFHKISDTAGGFSTTLDNTDRFGSSVAVISDVDGNGVRDWIVGAPLDDDGAADAGAVYLLFMNADGTVADEAKVSNGATNFDYVLDSGDRFGASVDSIGDIDRDGIDEILVGAWQDDDGGSNRGASYILFFNSDGSLKRSQKISSTEGNFFGHLDNGDQLGFGLAAADLNNDGVKELLLGSFGDDDGGTDRGAIWIAYLKKIMSTSLLPYPKDVAFDINNADACTNTQDVTLHFYGENIHQAIIGNDQYFTGSEWMKLDDVENGLAWRLAEGEGEKTVYVRFRSRVKNQSETVIRTIQLRSDCELGG